MKKLIASLIILFSLASCVKNSYKPMGYILFRQAPKEGTDGFKLGWDHGCESGLATQFANGMYMDFYQWKKDPDIAMANPGPTEVERIRRRYPKELSHVNWDNPDDVKKNFSDYKNVFWIAHGFCRHSILGLQQAGDVEPRLPGEQHLYDPSHWSVGTVWKINSKGDTRWKNNW